MLQYALEATHGEPLYQRQTVQLARSRFHACTTGLVRAAGSCGIELRSVPAVVLSMAAVKGIFVAGSSCRR